jgi:hypothetical protein
MQGKSTTQCERAEEVERTTNDERAIGKEEHHRLRASHPHESTK